MTNKKDTSSPIRMISLLFIGFSLSAIFIFLYCGMYAIPSADDYAYANAVSNSDFWKSQLDIYKGWSGRYTATFIITAVGNYLLGSYWLVPYTSILFLIISSYICFWTIFFNLRKEPLFYFFPIIFIALFMCSSISGHGVSVINEGFFWLAGAATYQIGASFYFIAISTFIWMARGKYIKTCTVLSMLFIFLAIGSNETLMVLSLFTFSLLSWFYRKRLNICILLILGVSLACCFIVFFAPGNNVRSGTAHGKDIFSALGICVEKTIQQYAYWLINPLLWLFVIYYYKLIKKMLGEIASHVQLRYFYSGLLLLVYGLYFPVAWALNSGAPDRLVSFIGFLAMMASLFFIRPLIPKIEKKLSANTLSLILCLLTVMLFPVTYEPLKVGVLTLWEGSEFYASHRKRNNYVKQIAHKGATSVGVLEIERNKLLLFKDLDNQDHSIHYAKYYGIESVFIIHE